MTLFQRYRYAEKSDRCRGDDRQNPTRPAGANGRATPGPPPCFRSRIHSTPWNAGRHWREESKRTRLSKISFPISNKCPIRAFSQPFNRTSVLAIAPFRRRRGVPLEILGRKPGILFLSFSPVYESSFGIVHRCVFVTFEQYSPTYSTQARRGRRTICLPKMVRAVIPRSSES